MKAFFNQSLYSAYYSLAIILIIAALFMQWFTINNDQTDSNNNDNYEELLSEHQKNNIFYRPELTTEWLASLQHPSGYFVNSEERLLDKSQLNVNTLETTRYVIAALDNLNNLEAINKKAVTNYVVGLYQPDKADSSTTSLAGFAKTQSAKPDLKATSHALTILRSVNGLNDSRINPAAITSFILSLQNSNGGFGDTINGLQTGQSSVESTSDAVAALHILYTHKNLSFNTQTEKAIRGYIENSLDSSSGGYASTDGGTTNDSYDTYSAYMTLLNLTQESKQDQSQNSSLKLNSDDLYWYLIDQHFISNIAAFKRYQNKAARPSLTATQKSVEVIHGIGRGDQINSQQIAQNVIKQQASSGQFGADVITTYSAIKLLQDIGVATKPVPAPVRVKSEPQKNNQYIPAILFIFAITLLIIAFSRKSKDQELVNQLLIGEVHTDSVTGIHNRKYFEEKGCDLVESCNQSHRKLTLISISIDELHIINDLRGYLAGDTVMKQLVKIIEPAIHSTSVFARWGGGVFMILTPDMDSEHAANIVGSITQSIEEHKFGFKRKLSCSFAVTEFSDGDSIDTLTNRVDKTLSKHKLNKMRSRKIGVHAA